MSLHETSGPPEAPPAHPAPPDPPELPAGVVPSDGRPAWKPSFAWLSLVAALAFAVVVGGLVAAAITAAAGGSLDDAPPGALISSTFLQDVGFIAVPIFFAAMVARPRPWQFGLRRTRLWPAAGWVAATYLAFLVFSAVFVTVFGVDAEEDLPQDLGVEDSDVALVASVLLICVMAPVAEEFLFRGFMFPALRRWRGTWPAAIIVGSLFGLIHVAGSPLEFIPLLMFFGIALCLLYARTKSLYPCIALHALNNSVAFSTSLDWSWQVGILLPAVAAVLVLLALLVERVFGPAPLRPLPV
jgi:membrane protease YdiL (CAAX protease family)